ncbi:MAG: hypothetical protein AAGL66_15340 [Pseudomonadota bacterium]
MKLPFLRRSTARTTLLGVAALGVLLWAAVTQLGVDVNNLLAQLILILLAVFGLAGVAALCGLLILLIKRRG